MMLRHVLVILAVWVASSVPLPHDPKDPNVEIYALLNEAATLLHEHHVHNLLHGHEGHTHKEDVYQRIKGLAPEHNNNKLAEPSPFEMDTSVHSTIDKSNYYADHYEENGQWKYAYCDMLPSSDLPDSKIGGRIDISHKDGGIDRSVFFDTNIRLGTNTQKDGGHYKLQVHEKGMTDQNCNATGAVFKKQRLTGLLGEFFVPKNEDFYRIVMPTLDIPFNTAVGKAIVLHATDISTGRSVPVRPIACCNIIQIQE